MLHVIMMQYIIIILVMFMAYVCVALTMVYSVSQPCVYMWHLRWVQVSNMCAKTM